MVALLLYGREPQKFSISDMRGTTNKLKPRQQVTRLWLDELKDIADISGCSRVLSLGSPPTFDDVFKALPTSEVRMATTFHQLMEMEWVSANTRLYHLIRKSIDLGGPMQESDLEYISKHFVRGELRDGVGLLRWLQQLNPSDSVSAQFDLNRKVASASLTTGTPNLIALEVHCTTLLSNWCKLVGNTLERPEGFYFQLLRSISEAPQGSKLSAVHQWLAGKVSDNAEMLSRPDTVIQELVRHGRTLHMPDNGSAALALAPSGDRDKRSGNNCSFCSSRICRAKDLGTTKKFCLVYNPQKPVPASASDNERTFVFSSRTYVDVVKPDTMKGVNWQTIQDTVKEHKGKVAPVVKAAGASNGAAAGEEAAPAPSAATGAVAAPIISSQSEFNAWFSSLNNGPAGSQKVINMVMHSPVGDRDGIASQRPDAGAASLPGLTALLHSHGYRLSEMDGQTFIKTDGAGTIRFAVHADDGAGWSNSRVLHKELCSILRGEWPNLQWKNDADCPMGFHVNRGRGSDRQHALIHHQSLTDGAVVNMIVPSEADDRGDEQGGSTSTDPPPPSQDQGGFDGHEPDEDDVREQIRQAVAANQAENNALLSTLRQRVEALDTPVTAPSRLNPFQTPGTVRLQPGGRGPGRGMLLDLNHTPSTQDRKSVV